MFHLGLVEQITHKIASGCCDFKPKKMCPLGIDLLPEDFGGYWPPLPPELAGACGQELDGPADGVRGAG